MTILANYNNEAWEALVNLLLRGLIEMKIIEEASIASLSAKAFLDLLESSRFFLESMDGVIVQIADFWDNYSEIFEMIIKSPNAFILKKGQPIEKASLIQEQEIISVMPFANVWNSK